MDDVTGGPRLRSAEPSDRVRVTHVKSFKALMDADAEDRILDLHVLGKWEQIINEFERNKFLPWIWPEKKNLEFIAKSVRNQSCESLISIGCGSGLLEWLLEMATGIKVTGIEIEGNWWKSKYSSGTFIPLELVDVSKKGDFGVVDTNNSVLLFCYFNNLDAFLGYIRNFKGDCFIVIGPGEGRGTYAIPEPFRLPKIVDEDWKLSDHQEIRSSKDFIAVYVKKQNNNNNNINEKLE